VPAYNSIVKRHSGKGLLTAWELRLAVALVIASLVLLILHYLVFRDLHHILIFTAHDIAFLPLEVLFVSLFIEKLIERRERLELTAKVRMVSGAAFTEVGNDLFRLVRPLLPPEILQSLMKPALEEALASPRPRTQLIESVLERLALQSVGRADLARIRSLLMEKQEFLLHLFENPVLVGNETFSDALRALFHLSEELSYRTDIETVPDTDVEHLAGDLSRALRALLVEWIEYLAYLKEEYPYLYSLALRANPFEAESAVEVTA
jgi:hypothetical protein